jgi:hypothetical protein
VRESRVEVGEAEGAPADGSATIEISDLLVKGGENLTVQFGLSGKPKGDVTYCVGILFIGQEDWPLTADWFAKLDKAMLVRQPFGVASVKYARLYYVTPEKVESGEQPIHGEAILIGEQAVNRMRQDGRSVAYTGVAQLYVPSSTGNGEWLGTEGTKQMDLVTQGTEEVVGLPVRNDVIVGTGNFSLGILARKEGEGDATYTLVSNVLSQKLSVEKDDEGRFSAREK